MFKKLKQKIEEGDVGIEGSSFSPSRLPGSIVRASSFTDGPTSSQPVFETELPEPFHSSSQAQQKQNGKLPGHLNSQSHKNYQAVLELRVKELEQECRALEEQLSQQSSQHSTIISELERRISELDHLKANLKMQIVELELEKASFQHEHDMKVGELLDKLSKQEELASASDTKLKDQIKRLEAEIEEKERCIINEENKSIAWERKAHHFESQLHAYETSSENEVVSRLHNEIADVEQRVKSRNVEIQILERRLASQAKENEEQIERMLNRQEELEQIYTEAVQVSKAEKEAKKELVKEVERLHEACDDARKVQEDIKTQFAVEKETNQQLILECEKLRRNNATQLHEMECVVEDRDQHIRELGRQLKQIHGGDSIISEPLRHPPGVPRRTASLGVQTSGAAYLPSLNVEDIKGDTKASVNVNELEAMKKKQCALDEELADKLKIIKIQQQRIMDLKKELRFQVTSDHSASDRCSPAPPRVAIASDVNFQYLKHVVIKFMCSREDEALQLIRAVATLLEFSPQEEEHIRGYLNYKMSWFGVLPPPLFPHK